MNIAQKIEKAMNEGRNILMEDESKQILSLAGITVNHCRPVFSPEEASVAAVEIGFPAALKVRSSVITHKSDVGGVYLDLNDALSVRQAFIEMKEKTGAIDPRAGATVQKMVPRGIEVIIGVTKDRQFGPVVAFGMGGALVNLMDDLCFRMVPLTEKDALQIMEKIKGSRLLAGYRGNPGADRKSLADILLKVSMLAQNHPEILEIDLNPVIARPEGAVVVDARMVLSS
ncbi:MAG: acetate--CoA ligase family protein [Bacillota bacterium]